MKATETNVHKLLQGTKVFLVPNFQRRYSWRLPEWQDLWDDIVAETSEPPVRDTSTQDIEGHFLGSVVLHPAGGPASTVTKHLVIDGQQRLTTLLVIIAVLRDVRQEQDPHFDPAKYDNQYLSNPYDPSDHDRLVPTTLDRDAYASTIRGGNPQGGIGQAYVWFRDAILAWVSERGEAPINETFERLEQAVLLRMMFVEISTSKDDAINTIFNTLNSKGKPLSAADLIRNEVLLYLSPTLADDVHGQYWLPMERALIIETKRKVDDSRLVGYFWARELTHGSNVAIKDLFTPFQRRMRALVKGGNGEKKVVQEVTEIFRDHDLYVAVLNPRHSSGRASGIGPLVRDKLEELRAWGSAPHIPVTYAVLSNLAAGRLGEAEAVSSLDALLSYLVRRALVGLPTNNLNRMLSGIPEKLWSDPSPGATVVNALSRVGMHWPTNEEVFESGRTTTLYLSAKRVQVHYILSKLERFMQKKEPVDTATLQIEHIFPQKSSAQWEEDLGGWGGDLDNMRALLHTIGNLTLTGHNSKLSNHAFAVKAAAYQESPLALNRELALKEEAGWAEDDVLARADRLLELCVAIWRGPSEEILEQDRLSFTGDEGDSLQDLKDLLNSIPEGSFTTVEALVEALGVEEGK